MLFFWRRLGNSSRCVALAGLLTPSAVTLAAPFPAVPAAINDLDREQGLERKRQLEDLISSEMREAEGKAGAGNAPLEPITAAPQLPEDGAGFRIDHIVLASDRELPFAVDDLINAYQGQVLNRQQIFRLIRALSVRFHQHGYATTVVGLSAQNLRAGTLELQVQWGLVKGLLIDGVPPQTLRERMMLASALPGVVGEPLNMRAIDQAIENMNTVAKQARIDIVAADEPGHSLLNVKLSDGAGPYLVLSTDNAGAAGASDGRDRYSANVSLADLVLPNDTFNVSGYFKHYRDRADNASQGGSARYALPWGANIFSAQYSRSIYRQSIKSGTRSYPASGWSDTSALNFTRIMWRDQDKKLTFYSDLRRKVNANYLMGSLIGVSSVDYTEAGMGARWVSRLFSGSFYADAGVDFGLPWWNGAYGAANIQSEDPLTGARRQHAKHYRTFKGNLSLNQYFNLLSRQVIYGARIGWQYSDDHLLGAYQMALGDEYTVRGFKGTPVMVDKGIYLNQTLSMPFAGPAGGQISPFVGVDAGFGVNNDDVPVNPNPRPVSIRPLIYAEGVRNADVAIAGISLGVKYQNKHAGFSLSFARPLKKPAWLQAGDVLYFSSNFSF